SSTIVALISPGLPSMSVRMSRSPERIELLTSFTHFGQSESVSRGQPNFGNVRSLRLSKGAGAHLGWTAGRSNLWLYFLTSGQTALAPRVRSFSAARVARFRVDAGIARGAGRLAVEVE